MTNLESFIALVIAYSLNPSCRSMSLNVPIHPKNEIHESQSQMNLILNFAYRSVFISMIILMLLVTRKKTPFS